MKEINTPKELYHYTSLETFFNIIRGNELWFFDTLSNYDKNEYILVEKKIKEVFKKQYNYDCRKKGKEIAHSYYSLSLTSEEDSFFHFHKYANENTGVCICFDVDKFTSALNNMYHINNGKIIDIVPMSYKKNYELEEIIIQEIENNNKLFNLETAVENDKHLEQLYNTIYYKLSKVVKSSNYKAENEYRFFYNDMRKSANILLNCLDGNEINETKKDTLLEIMHKVDKQLGYKEDFVCANGKIRKCCKINITPIINKNIISKIIIGSKCKNSIDDIKVFLKHYDISIKQVVSSQINID